MSQNGTDEKTPVNAAINEAVLLSETYSFKEDTSFVNGVLSAFEKMENRDEAVQTLQAIMGGGDITNDEMVTNALEAVEVSKLIESEGNIESLIKAQGIQECVVYLDGESAKVVVKTEGLDKAQAAAIKDIILGEVTIPAENIRIFEVK